VGDDDDTGVPPPLPRPRGDLRSPRDPRDCFGVCVGVVFFFFFFFFFDFVPNAASSLRPRPRGIGIALSNV
jgi:hypothetical protein